LQFSIACVGVRNLLGDVESIILICHDITESLRLSNEIVETQRELLYMLGDVVESRSQETAQHVRRVAVVSRFLALKVGLAPEIADMIETAAPMHDVGKVGIRDAVLHKQGKLEHDEFEEMKHHARIGHDILGKVDRPLVALAATIAHQHHERWDGSGYPYGLKGEDIDIAGRIVAVTDVLDALSSARVYKPAWDEQRVIEYFKTQRGLQFDPKLVDILLEHWDAIKTLRLNSVAS
jgi:response regulator RpfG family c-di-GMP phosphodiesterase